jgi:hypothetical protein
MQVGSDVGSLCRKCGDVWHVVVAVVDGRIAKVECKQCGGRHRFRSPDADSTTPAKRKATRVGQPRRTRAGSRAPTSEPNLALPPRPYQPSQSYTEGDRLVHPRFGEGVVQASAGPMKVRVLFIDGEKTLVQARQVAQ